MFKKRPYTTELKNLVIRKQDEDAVIDYRVGDVQTVVLHIGPEIAQMTDEDIYLLFVRILEAQKEMSSSFIPPRSPSIVKSEE